jgi:hypothetical protein
VQMLLLGVLGTHSVVLCVAKLSLLPLRLYAAMPHASMPPCFYARAGLHVESLFPCRILAHPHSNCLAPLLFCAPHACPSVLALTLALPLALPLAVSDLKGPEALREACAT